MSLQIAQAAVDDATIHFDKLYSYCIPPRLNDKVWPGSMVLVPFGRGNKPRMAVVLSVAALPEDADTQKLKTLYDAAPAEARLTPDLLELVRFLKDRTFCTWFEAVKAVIPYGAQYRAAVENGRPVMQNRLSRSTERLYTLAGELPAKPKPGPRQLAAMEALSTGPKTARQLDEAGISKATLDTLCKKGVLTVAEQDKSLDLFADIPFDPQPLTLSEEQQKAFATLLPDLEDDKPHAALLHGVTGSGKTVVFLKLIERTLELGRRALVLVPEISLTPQMIRRLKSTFGSRLAVQHSALNNTERLLQWRMIQQGNADIVVGTRSAVFSPLQNLGLIIVDEEQEHTYQSESAPRYDAHDIAKKRAVMENALLVFASATPLTETYHAAQSGKLKLVTLTQRYGGCPLPSVDFIDMRAELTAGNSREVSRRLARELQENLDNGEQSILLLNRRGYRTIGMCTDCGHVLKCPNCSVPLVYHKPQQALMCHHCGQKLPTGQDYDKRTLAGVPRIATQQFGQGFRAYESVFSLVTQVIGRGGRAALPGRALIQTAVPDHPVLQLAAAQDYEAYYREEITFRKFGLYPPFCAFCVIGFVGAQEGAVLIAAQRFGSLLAERAAQRPGLPLRILGPAPMNITMLNGKFRYKLTLKCRNDTAFRTLLRETLDAYAKEKMPQKASVIVDFNSDGDL